jgi:hypothetical protein
LARLWEATMAVVDTVAEMTAEMMEAVTMEAVIMAVEVEMEVVTSAEEMGVVISVEATLVEEISKCLGSILSTELL